MADKIKTKKCRLHNKAQNGAAKNWEGRMVLKGGFYVPRDPSYLLIWQGKHAPSGVTEL